MKCTEKFDHSEDHADFVISFCFCFLYSAMGWSWAIQGCYDYFVLVKSVLTERQSSPQYRCTQVDLVLFVVVILL